MSETVKKGEEVLDMSHFVCTGDCAGVAQSPGTCQAAECANHQKPLQGCSCGDEKHAAVESDASTTDDSSETSN